MILVPNPHVSLLILETVIKWVDSTMNSLPSEPVVATNPASFWERRKPARSVTLCSSSAGRSIIDVVAIRMPDYRSASELPRNHSVSETSKVVKHWTTRTLHRSNTRNAIHSGGQRRGSAVPSKQHIERMRFGFTTLFCGWLETLRMPLTSCRRHLSMHGDRGGSFGEIRLFLRGCTKSPITM